jgi:putative hemolysin
MTLLFIVLILFCLALLTLFAHVDRLYTEMGKFFLEGVEDNIEHFENRIEPALKLDRGRGGLTFALLTQMTVVALAVLVSYLEFRHVPIEWGKVVETVVLLTVAVIVFAHLVPHVLINRTRGLWLVQLKPLLRASALLASPLVGLLSFSFSLSTLGAPRPAAVEPPTPSENIEALMERGEEEGLIEEEDRKLIQSVVEFGDKTVREAMTARPNIVAVDKNATLEDLLRAIENKPYSRVPVYVGTLDNIEGYVATREILQLSDEELKRARVGEYLRPVLFVPETKPVSDLLREMQQQKIHMAIVVDEYGQVAGLATMEDLLEEIVGEIHDETETATDIIAEGDQSYVVPGNLDIDRLEELFGVRPEPPGDATTVAGLVNALAGHVPQPGETLEHSGLRFEILAGNGLKVDRLRVRQLKTVTE